MKTFLGLASGSDTQIDHLSLSKYHQSDYKDVSSGEKLELSNKVEKLSNQGLL